MIPTPAIVRPRKCVLLPRNPARPLARTAVAAAAVAVVATVAEVAVAVGAVAAEIITIIITTAVGVVVAGVVEPVVEICFLLLKDCFHWHYRRDGHHAAAIQTHGRTPGPFVSLSDGGF